MNTRTRGDPRAFTKLVDAAYAVDLRYPTWALGLLESTQDGTHLIARDSDHRGFLNSLAMSDGQELGEAIRQDLTRALPHILAGLRLRFRLSSKPVTSTAMLPSTSASASLTRPADIPVGHEATDGAA
jgi:hypothetical protein